MRELRFDRKPALSGKARSLLVFLHGYGANGADLFGLADPLAPHLPDTVFLAPDAPEPTQGGYGLQWFPIPWLDGSSEEAAREGLARASADLNHFLDAQLAKEGLDDSALCLLGFSQGAMIAMHVAPRRKVAMAGVVVISGRLLAPEQIGEITAKPPVLLIHGDDDQVVPFANMAHAGDVLTGAGIETYGHVMRGTGHGIAPDGLSVALAFLKDKLP
ncbi:MAG: alpha/beta hydrolase [Paracoccaceae bacterium]